ncbi:hypothetical protein EXIGLDRAFT_844434 [Exidia glandulosa HHB12029]|uniref:F-box domain-containing protein n=1 Tax=Exidia glandulosa HHB12029 TaxID=1314781 RepID=A0A165C1N7_EXIGL|nr:hypothetical protein EXIGLDRAFT_844434 [Exidia glandulosa HHB12029]
MDETDEATFEELAFRLATRAFGDTIAPSDAPNTVESIAKRGISRAARLYNEQQLLARVPPELLWMIFSLLAIDDRISVTFVSHRWRTISLNHGSLWAEINTADSMDFMNWQLQHSGSAPLRITAEPLRASDVDRVDLVAANMGRAQTLAVRARSDVLSRVLLSPASLLERLNITGVARAVLSHELFTNGVRWPALRELSVINTHLPHDLAFVQLLVMFPALESLEYTLYTLAEGGKDAILTSSITTYVPRLLSVSFIGMTGQLAAVLPHLRTVRDIEIRNHGPADDESILPLLPGLIARDEDDHVVNALITWEEIRLRFDRSMRICYDPGDEDICWILGQESFFGHLTTLALVAELPKKPFPLAPVLRMLILLDATLAQWMQYKFPWRTPALEVLCVGKHPDNMEDGQDIAHIDRHRLCSVLQSVFGFSADRRLPSLVIRNAVLEDGSVVGQPVLEDLVQTLDVIQDREWDPWASIVTPSM